MTEEFHKYIGCIIESYEKINKENERLILVCRDLEDQLVKSRTSIGNLSLMQSMAKEITDRDRQIEMYKSQIKLLSKPNVVKVQQQQPVFKQTHTEPPVSDKFDNRQIIQFSSVDQAIRQLNKAEEKTQEPVVKQKPVITFKKNNVDMVNKNNTIVTPPIAIISKTQEPITIQATQIPEITQKIPDVPTKVPDPDISQKITDPDVPTNVPDPDVPTKVPEPVVPTKVPEPVVPTKVPEPDVPTKVPEPEVPTKVHDVPAKVPEPEVTVKVPEPEMTAKVPEPVIPPEVPDESQVQQLPPPVRSSLNKVKIKGIIYFLTKTANDDQEHILYECNEGEIGQIIGKKKDNKYVFI